MTLVNDALPADALPDNQHRPCRDARYALGYSEELNVCRELLDRNLEAGRADRPAICHKGQTWTYAVLSDRVNRLANALIANGLKPGDRVLLHLLNVPEFVETWLAVLRIGGVVVATVPLLGPRELQYIIEQTEPACLVTSSELRPLFGEFTPQLGMCIVVGKDCTGELAYEDLLLGASYGHLAVRTAAEDVAIIAYTSGTTGRPKGTIHTHGDLLAVADTYAQEVLTPRSEDRFAGHSPFAFTYALGALLLFPFRFGASVILESSPFDPVRWLEMIAREHPTLLFATPTSCRLFMEDSACRRKTTWRTVRAVVSAGQKLPPTTSLQWKQVTGVDVLDGCGSTEMLHIWISQRRNEAIDGCTGRLVRLYDATLLDDAGQAIREQEAEGVIALRGPTGARYWRSPNCQSESVRNGWTLPGDRFRRDQEGRYWHIARTDDLIVTGGYKVAPSEVEEVIMQHPFVREVIVVGVADDLRGQVVKAMVTLRGGVKPGESTGRAIQEYVRREIAHFKCPRSIQIVEAIPRTPTGKPDRRRFANDLA